jgi:hypothetical protein
MDSHKLPNDGEHELLVGVEDVLGADADQVDLHLFACIEGNLAVDALLEHVVSVLFDTVPLNDCGVDLVDNLEQEITGPALLVQVIDEHAFNVEGVDPQSEGTLLSGAFHGVIVGETCSFESLFFFFGQLLKAVLGVENFGDIDRVGFGVSFNEVFSIHDMGNTQSVGVVDQRLGALEVVGFAEVVQGAFLLVQLVEHVADGIAVLKVFT